MNVNMYLKHQNVNSTLFSTLKITSFPCYLGYYSSIFVSVIVFKFLPLKVEPPLLVVDAQKC